MELGLRAHSDIRVWFGDAPVGVGFMLDATHAMTCAHVVADALGDRKFKDLEAAPQALIDIDFPTLADRNGPRVTRQARVKIWRPATLGPPPGGLPAARDDVAVLELTEPAPPNSRGVTAGPMPKEDEPFAAFGVTRANPQGTIVRGQYAGVVSGNRDQIKAEKEDDRPEFGCSGGAAWNLIHGGIMGMIVSRLGVASGEIIPIRCLRTVFDIPMFRGIDAPPQLQPAAPAAVSRRLAEQLERYDRQPQLADLQDALDDLWAVKRRPIAYLMACRKSDRPELLQRRFVSEQLLTHLEALKINGQRLSPQELTWPNQRGLNVERQLSNLKGQIKLHLPEGVDAASVRARYNASLRPLAFYSRISAANFDASHEALLSAWLKFWAEVGEGEPLNKPLVVFIRLQLEDTAHDGPLLQLFESCYDAPPHPVVKGLPLLADFDDQEIVDWLVEVMSEPELDSHRPFVEQSMRQAMGAKRMRLDELLTWARNLPI